MGRSKLGTNTVSGYVDHLGIIQKKDNTLGAITIGEDSIVCTPRGSNISTPVLIKNSDFRAIKCSELTRALVNKCYFKQCLVYFEEEAFKMKVNPLQLIDDIPTIMQPPTGDLSKYADGIELNSNTTEADKSEIDNIYSELYDGDDKEGMNSVKYSTNSRLDLIGDSNIVEIIVSGSDVYTDTINFNGIIHHFTAPNLSGIVNIDVRYSFSDSSIKNDSISFNLFSYDSEGSLTSRNFIQDVNDEIRCEFINGVLRLFPLSTNICECIINNCVLTYGKF